MKTTIIAWASAITLLAASPAQAAIWDFSWLSEAMFGRTPVGDPGVTREASGTSTATITPGDAGGITVGFDTAFGPGSVNVAPDGQAIGNVPTFRERDADPSIVSPAGLGTYTFSGGTFDNPDSFTVTVGHPGSGPDPGVRFSGTGTRHTVSADEPEMVLLLVSALAAVAWLRRRAQ